jgi:GDPmannose 4,6-dehydratase
MAGLDLGKHVEIDRAFFRPSEVDDLRGDPSKAFKKLGWKPKISFEGLVHDMLENDMELEGLDPAKHLRKPTAKTA